MLAFRFLFASAFFCAACNIEGPQDYSASTDSKNTQANDMIVAGPSQIPFDKRFNINLKLPMAESEFLLLAKNLDLFIERRGENELIPKPHRARYNPELDMTQISHALWIYKTRSFVDGKIECWAAFVNHDNFIVYIESAYTFDEPAR